MIKYNAIELGRELEKAIDAIEKAIDILELIIDTERIEALRAEVNYLENLKVEIKTKDYEDVQEADE